MIFFAISGNFEEFTSGRKMGTEDSSEMGEEWRAQKWDLDTEMIDDRGGITNQWKSAKKRWSFQ